METALANAVVENTRGFQGLCVPPFLKRGGFVFFAADNTDFAEDTPDGKGTTHGTIIAVYQKDAPSGEPIAEPLAIGEAKNLTVTPYHVDILHCDKPKPQHAKRTEQFAISKGIPLSYQLTQLGWFVTNALSRMKPGKSSSKIPGWAGYNSLLSESRPLTKVGALPLLPEVVHEWFTLLTVLMQASQLRRLAVGDDHPTIITFDMALYEKVLQLLDARPQLKKIIVPRLGELHAIMAAMRGLGSSIENSGIDDAWIEADVFGASTTRQILKVTHYKRALLAHIYTSTALYEMVFELFFEDKPEQKCATVIAAEEVEAACSEAEVTDGLLSTLAGFVCAAYAPKGITIKMIPELRWHLFTKHMAESDKLPPTIGALKQHILRVHIQARVWGQAAIAHQDAQLDPLENGYFKDADGG